VETPNSPRWRCRQWGRGWERLPVSAAGRWKRHRRPGLAVTPPDRVPRIRGRPIRLHGPPSRWERPAPWSRRRSHRSVDGPPFPRHEYPYTKAPIAAT